MKACTLGTLGVVVLVSIAGCGEEDSSVDDGYPYDPNETQIIGGGNQSGPVETP